MTIRKAIALASVIAAAGFVWHCSVPWPEPLNLEIPADSEDPNTARAARLLTVKCSSDFSAHFRPVIVASNSRILHRRAVCLRTLCDAPGTSGFRSMHRQLASGIRRRELAPIRRRVTQFGPRQTDQAPKYRSHSDWAARLLGLVESTGTSRSRLRSDRDFRLVAGKHVFETARVAVCRFRELGR
jgi:hypothetical protein